MGIQALFYTGVMIAVGLVFGKLAKYVRLPNVTGYLIGGLLIGPSVLKIFNETTFENLDLILTVALGFIAFSIGNEFKISYFKRAGMGSVVIAFFEAFFGVIFVFAAMLIFYAIKGEFTIDNIRFSLVLSSIAAATAPASTLMVIKQYKARGALTDTLLSVVAIDDSIGIILFGIFVAIANTLSPTGGASTSLLLQILNPFWEILISLAVGGFFGLVVTFGCKWFTGRGNRISLVIASLFLTLYIGNLVHGSNLLAAMMMGAVFANLSNKYEEVSGLVYFVTPPIFILFFVISGGELKLSVLSAVGLIGILYVIFRVVGKIFGAWFGAKISHSPKVVSNYLGYMLVPQEGVSIGLAIAAMQVLDTSMATQIRVIILSAVLIYELTGPMITKLTLKRSGEITLAV